MSISVCQPLQAAFQSFNAHQYETSPLALTWSFRLMVDLQGHRKLLRNDGIEHDAIACALGLEKWVEAERYNRQRAVQQLRGNAWKQEEQSGGNDYPEPLRGNLVALARLLDLDALEQQILGLCVLKISDGLLNDCVDLLGAFGGQRLYQVLAILLRQPREAIQKALHKNGRLLGSGLLDIDFQAERFGLNGLLNFRNHDLAGRLCHYSGMAEELFQDAFRPSAPARLAMQDYSHMQAEIDIALRYLGKSWQRRRGVNVLIYGPPGTGKTELCRLLAAQLGGELYEVASSDSDGDPICGHQRLCALRVAQHVLRERCVLLMLDEIEDIFQAFGRRERRIHKSWVNRMLEENDHPCFWVSNDIRSLDPAYLRRFDLVIEVPNPDRQARERIIRNLCGDRLDESLLGRLIRHEDMTPAVFERAYQVARLAQPRAGRKQNQALECLLDATLKAQGHQPLEDSGNGLPPLYAPELINTDIPLDDLLAGLRRCAQARLCFYGLPGTGKSAFARWLAESLGKPLLVKCVSDLVSPFVGVTEQNLAAAFQQAEQEDAVLLLDEVDSFLQNRRNARHAWEITAVNEMLTRMECFEGLFIASTNLMDDLDEAALRRFDLKVNFQALRPQQIDQLLQMHLKALKLKDPQQLARQRILGLTNLAPGDFASVARRARFKPFASATAFAEALLGEVRLKRGGASRPIGFVQNG